MAISDPLQRVVVVGCSCAGKTTFGAALADALGCTAFDLDPLNYGHDWRVKPLAEFRELVAQAATSQRWVASGNYAEVRDILWGRATAIVWLNYGFSTVMTRALRRTVRRATRREALWHGNRETFRMSFLSRESVLLNVATSFAARREQIGALRAADAFPGVAWIEFHSPQQAGRYLAQFRKDS